MLPGLDGYRVLRQLRDDGRTMPVLILTAKGEEADKVLGFRLDADDYVTKPFGLLELMALVAAHLRRSRPGSWQHGGVRRFGDVEVEPATRTVQRGGEPVPLTPMESDLLLALLDRNGAIASRLELLKESGGTRRRPHADGGYAHRRAAAQTRAFSARERLGEAATA